MLPPPIILQVAFLQGPFRFPSSTISLKLPLQAAPSAIASVQNKTERPSVLSASAGISQRSSPYQPALCLCLFFRHIKALESRSQLLDTALTSADEANRRWEHCRVHADQLQIENAALRAENATLRAENAALRGALGAPAALPSVTSVPPANGSSETSALLQEESKADGIAEQEMDADVPVTSENKE